MSGERDTKPGGHTHTAAELTTLSHGWAETKLNTKVTQKEQSQSVQGLK